MLKRTSLKFVNSLLKKNKNWSILDIGCGYTANENATVIADVQNLSEFYKERKFIKINSEKLPFKDNEFDYVIASHVIEHVKDFKSFIKELERISKRGYVELPTRFGDNLIFENVHDHIWWFTFDDINNKLLASKKNQIIDPFMSVATGKQLQENFRESFVLELEWENKIDHELSEDIRNLEASKISFFKLVKKYISKKIRIVLKNKKTIK